MAIHIKGYGRGIDFTSQATQRLAQAVVAHVVAQKPQTIVWDGDSYHPSSYTALLPRIRAALLAADHRAVFVAYLKHRDEARFAASWQSAPEGFAVDKIEFQRNDIDFTELGVIALAATQSKNVVCFGGGPVVGSEFAHADPSVQFHWWPVERPVRGDQGGALERCSLAAVGVAPNLHRHEASETVVGVAADSNLKAKQKRSRLQ
jgi:hypothetical protein